MKSTKKIKTKELKTWPQQQDISNKLNCSGRANNYFKTQIIILKFN